MGRRNKELNGSTGLETRPDMTGRSRYAEVLRGEEADKTGAIRAGAEVLPEMLQARLGAKGGPGGWSGGPLVREWAGLSERGKELGNER